MIREAGSGMDDQCSEHDLHNALADVPGSKVEPQVEEMDSCSLEMVSQKLGSRRSST